ncbi:MULTISPECIES: ABC-type transport auxiliary lipoprotein family protein [unclassified Phenylobacterium]|uniref:ABC-type transport auxiliary lipoprotein family protein n=1 Tax=unclassified Phenylobacterium TaxID=2640670 RepID=UPI0022B2C72B|nr:ABC-type transport auxiliary lipoprotein family protein [Phenylobacterium sp. NIBR 498073]MBS0489776.1 membrane integrity-associated transporter subunit PqiC [Pseudomonadota bacterium]WGU42015.1 ABC-type transport auxiliary lipoprotein family protein [Phenylobacterium sp. NIBR 498073]
MNALKRTLPALALMACSALLAGCITLLPDEKPAQLYRFDGDIQAAAAGQTARFTIARLGGSFVQSAANDRILTINGSRAAYIADARWVSPASVLFNESLSRAFDTNTGAARLLTRGDFGKADYILRVDVTQFEAEYNQGSKAAPEIVVTLRATLTGSDRVLAGSRNFETRVRATSNRVSSIVEAYDEAVSQALGELVAWTNGRGA